MSVTTTAPPQKARTTAQNIGLILSFIVLGGILLLPTPETYTGNIIYRRSSYDWRPRLCYHLMDDLSCFLSSKCYYDYCTYSSALGILT